MMDRGAQQCKDFDTHTKYAREKNSKLFTLYEFNTRASEKIRPSGIIPFVYVGKDEIHKYMQYEVSMSVFWGRIANQRK